MYTPESIKDLLNKSDAAVEKALLVLLDRQTADEQVMQATSHQNGMGFSAFDAEILTSFAQQVQTKMANGRELGQCLSEKQMALARKKVSRYAKQLAGVANEKAQAPAAPQAQPVAQEYETAAKAVADQASHLVASGKPAQAAALVEDFITAQAMIKEFQAA